MVLKWYQTFQIYSLNTRKINKIPSHLTLFVILISSYDSIKYSNFFFNSICQKLYENLLLCIGF